MIFVWRCRHTLRNYTSGMVVVSAVSKEAAWDKIKQADPCAWHRLRTGRHLFLFHDESAEEADRLAAEDIAEHGEPEAPFPLQPEQFSADDLPVLVIQGGE
jgi:hypothetical protein